MDFYGYDYALIVKADEPVKVLRGYYARRMWGMSLEAAVHESQFAAGNDNDEEA